MANRKKYILCWRTSCHLERTKVWSAWWDDPSWENTQPSNSTLPQPAWLLQYHNPKKLPSSLIYCHWNGLNHPLANKPWILHQRMKCNCERIHTFLSFFSIFSHKNIFLEGTNLHRHKWIQEKWSQLPFQRLRSKPRKYRFLGRQGGLSQSEVRGKRCLRLTDFKCFLRRAGRPTILPNQLDASYFH